MRLLILTLTLLISLLTFGQKSFKPTIVVLDPYNTKYDSTLLPMIEEYTYEAFISPENEKSTLDSLGQGEKNIQIMDVAEFQFRKKMNFGSHFTLSLNTMLTFMVFGQTSNCIVLPSHDISAGSINDLKSAAKKHNVQWVINPVSLYSYTKDGDKFTTVRIQVFNSKKSKVVLDSEYTGDTKNPGFELSCESGTLDCTVNNVINPSLHDILLTILGSYQH